MGDGRAGLLVDEFHPGADSSYRIYDPAKDRLAGNQCTYSKDGRLITDGAGAGTPDYFSSEASVVDHFLIDVLPFIIHGNDWQWYHQDPGWKPYSCPDCPQNFGDQPKPKPVWKPRPPGFEGPRI
jgi:hypothetical protein